MWPQRLAPYPVLAAELSPLTFEGRMQACCRSDAHFVNFINVAAALSPLACPSHSARPSSLS